MGDFVYSSKNHRYEGPDNFQSSPLPKEDDLYHEILFPTLTKLIKLQPEEADGLKTSGEWVTRFVEFIQEVPLHQICEWNGVKIRASKDEVAPLSGTRGQTQQQKEPRFDPKGDRIVVSKVKPNREGYDPKQGHDQFVAYTPSGAAAAADKHYNYKQADLEFGVKKIEKEIFSDKTKIDRQKYLIEAKEWVQPLEKIRTAITTVFSKRYTVKTKRAGADAEARKTDILAKIDAILTQYPTPEIVFEIDDDDDVDSKKGSSGDIQQIMSKLNPDLERLKQSNITHICNKLKTYKKVIQAEYPGKENILTESEQDRDNNETITEMKKAWKRWETWVYTADVVVQKFNDLKDHDLVKDWKEAVASINRIEDSRQDIKNYLFFMMQKFYVDPNLLITSLPHVILMGSSGTGKTYLAEKIGEILAKINILARGELMAETTAQDFIGGFVGQTANKTRQTLLNNLEKVLFIDEAYSLVGCTDTGEGSGGGNTFGSQDSIPEILTFITKYPGLQIIMLAGYETLMKKCFLASNEGIFRRFPYQFVLSAYSIPELTDIIIRNLAKNEIKFKNKQKITAILQERISRTLKQHPLDSIITFTKDVTRDMFLKFMKVATGDTSGYYFFAYQAADMVQIANAIIDAYVNSTFNAASASASASTSPNTKKKSKNPSSSSSVRQRMIRQTTIDKGFGFFTSQRMKLLKDKFEELKELTQKKEEISCSPATRPQPQGKRQ